MQFDGTGDLKELLSVTLKLFFLQRKFYIYIFIFLYFYIFIFYILNIMHGLVASLP
jgi:hypothetical protein